jgi:hypothetical protein
VRVFLTTEYWRAEAAMDADAASASGTLPAAALQALGAVMGGAHPSAFQPILDLFIAVLQGSPERPANTASALDGASTPTPAAAPAVSPSGPVGEAAWVRLRASRRVAFGVLDNVSAAFKVRRPHITATALREGKRERERDSRMPPHIHTDTDTDAYIHTARWPRLGAVASDSV